MVDMDNLQNENVYFPSGIKSGNFDRVDIIYIPSGMESVMRIDQVGLENSYLYKISMRQIKATRYWSTLLKALNETKINKAYKLKDLRSAIFIYYQNKKIVSIYFDESGNYGAVNSIPVEFMGRGVYDWVDGNFLKVIK